MPSLAAFAGPYLNGVSMREEIMDFDDKDAADGRHEGARNPAGGLLAMFNAVELYEFYVRQKGKGAQLLNIMSFQGAKFPCTVGIVIGSHNSGIEPFFQSEDGVPRDEHVYFVYGMPGDFLNPAIQPIAELCVSGAFSLSNPFDPKFVNGASHQASQGRSDAAIDVPVLYKKKDGRLVKVGPVTFPFDILRADERTHSPLFDRIVELAGLNAMCEIFEGGLRDFHGLPVAMRRAGGDIDSRNYESYSEYLDLLRGHVNVALRSFLDAHKNGFTYENVVRIVRALSLPVELGKLPFAVSRWPQILDTHQLSADEQARQFEIEMIRLASQSSD
ncbi:hypothetical protein C5748_23250 [Phyllobacterium phragmitis]|uniref:Uncharacterized protein n=1 Tax=Phyllobacterium phragmitis TaxID=2670329 RepID=A0A2S9IKV5_9HYPH|nr:hypothetical protein [Phyllobacterium phragmitis]PRD41161.1 hypothetical protein C5748_23250 [Phyllobacterium phragmitis]